MTRKTPAAAGKRTALPAGYAGIHGSIVELLDAARQAAARSVNALMTASYWEIGRRIVDAGIGQMQAAREPHGENPYEYADARDRERGDECRLIELLPSGAGHRVEQKRRQRNPGHKAVQFRCGIRPKYLSTPAHKASQDQGKDRKQDFKC